MKRKGRIAAAAAVTLLIIVAVATSGNDEVAPTTSVAAVTTTTTTQATTTTTLWSPAPDTAAGKFVAAVRELTLEAHDPIGLTDAQLVGMFGALCQAMDDAGNDADTVDVYVMAQAYLEGGWTDNVDLANKLGAVTVEQCKASS